jgi:hypothetical protein
MRNISAVTLKYGSHSVTDQFLVNAGADITLIPMRIGMALNLPAPKRGEIFPLGEIGGFLPTVHRKEGMEIGNYRLEARIAWAQLKDHLCCLGVSMFSAFSKSLSTKKIE